MDGKSKSKYKLTIHIPKTDFLFFWTLQVFNSTVLVQSCFS